MKPFRLLFIKPYTYHFPLFTGNAEYKRIFMHFKAQDDGGLQNIERRISLGELSDSLFIDKSYLSKLFKQHFNMPVVSYIRNKQLLLADTMIKNGTPPTEVYLKCGFSDYSSFYRAYVKMFNRSPSKNKKCFFKHAKRAVTECPCYSPFLWRAGNCLKIKI